MISLPRRLANARPADRALFLIALIGSSSLPDLACLGELWLGQRVVKEAETEALQVKFCGVLLETSLSVVVLHGGLDLAFRVDSRTTMLRLDNQKPVRAAPFKSVVRGGGGGGRNRR